MTSRRSEPTGPALPRPPRGFLDDRDREEIIFMAAVELMNGFLSINGYMEVDRAIQSSFDIAEKMYGHAESRWKNSQPKRSDD